MQYQPMQTYGNYQPMPQPYQDRLAQLQSQYQQTVNIPQMAPQPQIKAQLSRATPVSRQILLVYFIFFPVRWLNRPGQ